MANLLVNIGEPECTSIYAPILMCWLLANHGMMSTTPVLESNARDLPRVATSPATNPAHSSPLASPYSAVAERSPVIVQAGELPTTHDTVVAESSSVVNRTQTLPSPNVVVAENSADIHDADNSSDAVVATGSSDIKGDGNTSGVPVAVSGNSSATAQQAGILGFPYLPPEIRNVIYRFVLQPPEDPSICLTQPFCTRRLETPSMGADTVDAFDPHSVVGNEFRERIMHWASPRDLSILLVSKETYAEAFHVFYSTHCFYFQDTGLLYSFLKTIGYNRRQYLTMVSFLWRGPDAKEAFRLLKSCRRLTTVSFTVPCSHPPGYEALKEVRAERAIACALVHFPPLGTHTSCFGDYSCHCRCRRPHEAPSSLKQLEDAIMRPRRQQHFPTPHAKLIPFNPKRECFPKSEDQNLLQDKISFDEFTDEMARQDRKLIHIGRRNKTKEAELNQTLRGVEALRYFHAFEEKLAEDERMRE